MFSFFKKKPSDQNVPEWASFFDGRQYAEFVKQIDHYFKSIHVDYEPGDGQIHAKENEFGFTRLGLVNVAQVCSRSATKHYREIIAEHFNSLVRANRFDTEFRKTVHDFDAVKKYLAVRLYSNEYADHIGKENTIGKDFAGDIYAMLVFDLPDSVVNVQHDNAAVWNKTTDELLDIGIANVRANCPMTISKQSLGEFNIWFVQGEHFFTANIAFDLENRKELVGSMGSLVGLPHRHSALIYPIENMEVVKAVNGLILTVHGMNQEGPGSLSNNLFWYKDGTFTQLPYKLSENKLQFIPPANFVALLNQLS